eukprot:m.814288 g.814288  ORF g.814288 m.814288 type:complete len:412 (+) comp23394_c0_seq2:2473-3708(+)
MRLVALHAATTQCTEQERNTCLREIGDDVCGHVWCMHQSDMLHGEDGHGATLARLNATLALQQFHKALGVELHCVAHGRHRVQPGRLEQSLAVQILFPLVEPCQRQSTGHHHRTHVQHMSLCTHVLHMSLLCTCVQTCHRCTQVQHAGGCMPRVTVDEQKRACAVRVERNDWARAATEVQATQAPHTSTFALVPYVVFGVFQALHFVVKIRANGAHFVPKRSVCILIQCHISVVHVHDFAPLIGCGSVAVFLVSVDLETEVHDVLKLPAQQAAQQHERFVEVFGEQDEVKVVAQRLEDARDLRWGGLAADAKVVRVAVVQQCLIAPFGVLPVLVRLRKELIEGDLGAAHADNVLVRVPVVPRRHELCHGLTQHRHLPARGNQLPDVFLRPRRVATAEEIIRVHAGDGNVGL